MDQLVGLGQKYGWWLPTLYLLVKYGHISWKKRSGRYVSWAAMENKIKFLELEQARGRADRTEMRTDLGEHLKKEAEEDIRMERMHTRLGALENQVERENGHIFKQLEVLHGTVKSNYESIMGAILKITTGGK